jgi:hypothetical protein
MQHWQHHVSCAALASWDWACSIGRRLCILIVTFFERPAQHIGLCIIFQTVFHMYLLKIVVQDSVVPSLGASFLSGAFKRNAAMRPRLMTRITLASSLKR